MAENKKSVLLYCDIIHTVEELSDEEAGKLFKHYLRYVNDMNPEAPDKLTQIVFEPIKQTLKRDLRKWEIEIAKKSSSGILGNLKRWHNDLYLKVLSQSISIEEATKIAEGRKVSHSDKNKSHKVANIAVSDSVIVKDNVSVIDIYFFRLRGEIIKQKLSDFMIMNFQVAISDWCMNNKVDKQKLLEQVDKDYPTGYAFNNENHMMNAFKRSGEKILKEKSKGNFQQAATATSASIPSRPSQD